MRKLVLLVASLAIMALGAGNAMAFDNIAVGDTAHATNVTGITLGSFITCNSSTLSGPVTVNNGSDLGGSGDITTADFWNCHDSLGGTPTVTATGLPWKLSIDGSGAATVSGIDVDISIGSGCRYTGSISGQYDAADWGGNGNAPLSGSLTRQSGGFPCTTTAAVGGTYNVVGPNGVIDL